MKREKKEKGASGLDMYTTCHVECEKQHRGTRDHTRLFELFSYKNFVSSMSQLICTGEARQGHGDRNACFSL